MQPDEDEAGASGQESGKSPVNAAEARGGMPRDGGHEDGQIRPATPPGAEHTSAPRGTERESKHADGLRAAVLVFARARLAPLSVEDAAALAALTDERELTELVDTLAQASSVEEARAVLAAAIAGTRK